MSRAWLVLVILALLISMLPAFVAQAASGPRLLAVHVQPTARANGDGARLVLEVSRAISFDAGVQAAPLRLEVLVPGLRLAGKVRRRGQAGMLGKVVLKRVSGGVLLSVPLKEPALIVDAHAERAAQGQPARLVVNLARTDAATLARMLGVPREELLKAGRAAASTPANEVAGAREPGTLEQIKQAYRRLIEQAVATPADIGDLIKALPLDFAELETDSSAANSSPKRDAASKDSNRREKHTADSTIAAGGGARQPVIVLDAGHGGRDPGAIGPRGVKEKDIVLRFAHALRDALEKRGHVVVMTRTGDTYLKLRQRVQVARAHHAALFISIHADKFRRRGVSGLGIYTLSEKASDADAAELARMENAADLIGAPEDELQDDEVRDILVELTQRETNANSHLLATRLVRALRGVVRLRRNPVRSAAFRVLRAPEIPSLLVELGYITNPRDVRNMLSVAWRRKVAARMAETIDKMLKERLALR